MKNWQSVMWGKMLWALFLPQVTRLCSQKWDSWFWSGPLGRKYSTYSLGSGSSRNGSSTWENNLRVVGGRAKGQRAFLQEAVYHFML